MIKQGNRGGRREREGKKGVEGKYGEKGSGGEGEKRIEGFSIFPRIIPVLKPFSPARIF